MLLRRVADSTMPRVQVRVFCSFSQVGYSYLMQTLHLEAKACLSKMYQSRRNSVFLCLLLVYRRNARDSSKSQPKQHRFPRKLHAVPPRSQLKSEKHSPALGSPLTQPCCCRCLPRTHHSRLRSGARTPLSGSRRCPSCCAQSPPPLRPRHPLLGLLQVSRRLVRWHCWDAPLCEVSPASHR